MRRGYWDGFVDGGALTGALLLLAYSFIYWG